MIKKALINFKKRKSYKLFIFCFIIFLFKYFLDYSNIFFFLPEIVQNFFYLFIFILKLLLIYYVILIVIWLYKKLTWKIRNKLIISHIFISVIPIILIIALIFLSIILLTYQISSFQINSYFTYKIEEIHKQILKEFNKLSNQTAKKEAFNSFIKYISQEYPFSVLIIQELPKGIGKIIISQNEYQSSEKFAYLFKKINKPFGIYYCRDITQLIKEKTKINTSISILPDVYYNFFFRLEKFNLLLFLPIENSYFDELNKIYGYSLVSNYYIEKILSSSNNFKITIEKQNDVPIPKDSNSTFPVLLLLKNISSSSNDNDYQAIILKINYKNTWNNILKDKSYIGLIGKSILKIILIMSIVFIIVEVISLLIGVKMTSSITKAVDSLYKASNNIQKGNLETKVDIKGAGQLTNLGDSFNIMVSSIKNLLQERAQKEAMEKELEIAKKVQEQLLPFPISDFPNIEIANKFLPARIVSGDYYDFLNFQNKLIIIVADVSGKGLSAGLIMANIQAIIRSFCNLRFCAQNANFNLLELINLINFHLLNYTPLNKFITMHISLLDIDNLSLTYCNAGHLPPIIIKENNEIIKLQSNGTILGSFENAKFSTNSIQLSKNDLIFYYTDGLIETTNEAFEEYGEDRFLNFILQNKKLPLKDLLEVLLEDVKNFSNARINDDIAIVGLRISG